jgi:carotenoid 1,2-hydratase
VFSPYYAWARRRGSADPLDHCALNVALYGAGRRRWSLTERGRAAVERRRSHLAIGPSSIAWDGSALTIAVDETTAPVPTRLRGIVRVHPHALMSSVFPLDAAGAHRWAPIAPCAHVEVELERPRLRWSGPGYFDSNAGDGPLEDAFARWDWSRGNQAGRTAVLYDVARRSGDALSLALRFGPSGTVVEMEPPPALRLPATRWGIARATRAGAGGASVLATLEDTPFYARSLLATRAPDAPGLAVHESLSLDRFRARWVQALLPFRMPRRTGARR